MERVNKMSLAAVIGSIEREMFERATKRNCGNCKWWGAEVCYNGDSDYDGYSTDRDFCCECHEFKEERA